MPAKAKCDWSIAKDLYCNGMTAKDVAEQMGVNILTVQKRASREDWSKDRVLTRQGAKVIPPSSVTELLNAEVSKWIKGAVRLTQRITDLANRTPVKPDLKQLRDATAILESIVKSGRAMFNLDKAQPDKPQQFAAAIRIGVTVDGGQASPPKAIDVATVSIDAQELTTSENQMQNQNALAGGGENTGPLVEPPAGDDGGGVPLDRP